MSNDPFNQETTIFDLFSAYNNDIYGWYNFDAVGTAVDSGARKIAVRVMSRSFGVQAAVPKANRRTYLDRQAGVGD